MFISYLKAARPRLLPFLKLSNMRLQHSSTQSEHEDFFRYTKGRWLFNEEKQLASRYTPFNIEALKRVACEAVAAKSCKSIVKLDEGHFNKVFLLTFNDESEVIARIPCPVALQSSPLATASEVATMDFARTVLKIPVPRVLSWSSDAENNSVGSDFIIMEKMSGVPLSSRWDDETKRQALVPMTDDILSIENKFFKATFALFGSLYYKEDVAVELQNAPLYSEVSEITEGADRFRVGPSIESTFWREGLADLKIDRGPWRTITEYAIAKARCEQEWIRAFAKPRPYIDPFRTSDPPATHIKWLDRAIRAFEDKNLLTPGDSDHRPILWHPDLTLKNIMVHAAPSPIRVSAIIDWQEAIVGSVMLQTDAAPALRYVGGRVEFTDDDRPALLPDDFDTLSEDDKRAVQGDKTRADVQKYYDLAVRKYYPARYDIVGRPDYEHVQRLVTAAGMSWRLLLLRIREILLMLQSEWDELFPGTDCPIDFSNEEVEEVIRDHQAATTFEAAMAKVMGAMGGYEDGWVTHDDYDISKARWLEEEKAWDSNANCGQYPFREGEEPL